MPSATRLDERFDPGVWYDATGPFVDGDLVTVQNKCKQSLVVFTGPAAPSDDDTSGYLLPPESPPLMVVIASKLWVRTTGRGRGKVNVSGAN